MTLSRLAGHIVFLSLLASAAMPASAALRLSVAATTRNQANPGATMPPDSAQQSEVVLADTYVSTRSGNTTLVFDFARRRRYVIDEAAKTYDEYSLYDVVGFRELELRNREGLRARLAAMKLDHPLPGELEDEHELSLPSAAPNPVAMRTDGDDDVFASGDVVLLRHGKDATPVGAADAARFVDYLRYVFAGHPAVLDALQKEQKIPAHLSYVFHPATGTRTVDLAIAVQRQADAPASPLAGYAPRPPASGAASLDASLDRAWAARTTLAANVARPSAEALASELRTQTPLDAYLEITELSLSGGRVPDLPDAQKAAFRSDPAVRLLGQALAAKDAAAWRQAVAILQALRSQAHARGYLLRLFEANDRILLNDATAARGLYAQVLQANPAVAGAYKDIGDFYFRSFDTPRAWRSWDIARALAPLFPNLAAVTQFEGTLASRYPAYFDGGGGTP